MQLLGGDQNGSEEKEKNNSLVYTLTTPTMESHTLMSTPANVMTQKSISLNSLMCSHVKECLVYFLSQHVQKMCNPITWI